MKMKIALGLVLAVLMAALVFAFPGRNNPGKTLNVFAASSFAWVLREQEALIEHKTGLDIIIVEAASSTLARQIVEGAPADVFITADKVWLEYLESHYEGNPLEIARNRLVFVLAPEAAGYCNVQFFAPPNAEHLLGVCPFEGKVAAGDPAYVPLGKYTMEAIVHYGWTLDLVPGQDARAALALLEKGATPAAILYRTDILGAGQGWADYEIPEQSHTPILYWAVAVKQSNPDATNKFLRLLKSEAFKTILQGKGFEVDEGG